MISHLLDEYSSNKTDASGNTGTKHQMYNNNKIFGNKVVEMEVDDIIAVHLTDLPILIVTQGLVVDVCY